MTNEEITELKAAQIAGIRVQVNALTNPPNSGWLDAHEIGHVHWSPNTLGYRIHPDDAEKWKRIKADALTKEQKYTGHVRCHKCGQSHWMHGPCTDALPPLPEGAVLLPVDFRKPEGGDRFDAWTWSDDMPEWDEGSCTGIVGDPTIRYAVPADSEIARLNGVGFGPCPSPHGWHNPDDDTPRAARVPERRLLCRDEIGERGEECDDIENKRGTKGFYGASEDVTYYTRLPYGELPPVTKYTFPECAPKPKDPGYGYDLDGTKISPPDDRHEIIPEGTRVSEGEVTHFRIVGKWIQWWPKHINPSSLQRNNMARVVGSIRAYARLKYEVLHRESGIKVGNTVRVVRKATEGERGWNNSWPQEMDVCVGETVTVLGDSGAAGFECESREIESSLCFPAFVLEKVTPQMVPLEGIDWKPGDVVRYTSDPDVIRSITSINLARGLVYAGSWLPPELLQRHYERLDPATGEWVRCEKEQQGK